VEKVTKDELPAFAHSILARVSSLASTRDDGAIIIALSGELGAGKTTFTQALARELGITETVQSPTYVLMKSYPIKINGEDHKLIHIDAYRLDSPEEFKTLKPETFLNDPKNLIIVEWPERLGNLLPKPDLTINFSSENANSDERFVEIKK
jgi:tRNA threonylcarbamoyladenosine biosynthesis protein TsaE